MQGTACIHSHKGRSKLGFQGMGEIRQEREGTEYCGLRVLDCSLWTKGDPK